MKRVLRYLKGTINYRLRYGNDQRGLIGYSDADWATDLDNRKSTSGYIFTMYGGAVNWRSKRQEVVALSSTEAELVSAVGCIQEGIWLKTFLKEVVEINSPVIINVDNNWAHRSDNAGEYINKMV